MSDDFKPGLEGVIGFESEIAEPDKEGSALRYRGVDIEDLVGRVSFGNVWGLLVDDEFNPGLPNAEKFPLPVHSGDVRVDVQAAISMLAPAWGLKPLLDIDDAEARSNLARASVMVLSYLAQAARGQIAPAVPESEIDKAHTVVERMMIRWRGEPDPAHVRAIDAYFVSAAEHGMNASTFTARVIASTGADIAAALSGAIGAMSGPLHGGAPSRVLHMIDEVEKTGDATTYVKGLLDRKERLMGFGHRVYRAEDPRARTLRRTAKELNAPRYAVAEARSNLARASVMVLSYLAQAARGQIAPAVPESEIDKAHTVVERMMIRWRGEPDPAHVRAIDAYFVSAAEHGMNASTFTARVIASTGADIAAALSGAIGAMSGPLHGGAPSRVLHMIDEVEKTGDATTYVKGLLDRKERLMGFGHRVYRAEDPRARTLRRTAKELNAPRYAVAEALEIAALKELRERQPDRVLETNVEFWAAIILDFAEVPSHLFTSMFTAARTAGWSAHILEEKRTGRLIRPSARYIGKAPRKPEAVKGWDGTVEQLHK